MHVTPSWTTVGASLTDCGLASPRRCRHASPIRWAATRRTDHIDTQPFWDIHRGRAVGTLDYHHPDPYVAIPAGFCSTFGTSAKSRLLLRGWCRECWVWVPGTPYQFLMAVGAPFAISPCFMGLRGFRTPNRVSPRIGPRCWRAEWTDNDQRSALSIRLLPARALQTSL
jgi:hypothetical protein